MQRLKRWLTPAGPAGRPGPAGHPDDAKLRQALGAAAEAVRDPGRWRKLLAHLREHGDLCARLVDQPAGVRNRLVALLSRALALAGHALASGRAHGHEDAWAHLDDLVELWKHQTDGCLAALNRHPRKARREALRRATLEVARELDFARAQRAGRVRELCLAELFSGIEGVAVPVGAVNELTGHPNHVDLLYVCAIARHRRARRILELGTYAGRTSYHLTFAADDAVVTTVNLPPEADPRHAPYLGSYFRGTDRAGRIRQVWCDSRTMDVTPYRGQMDFVFVDADHSREAVAADTARAFEALAPGGAIVWHDYAAKSPGVYEFMAEFTHKTPVFRVHKTCLLVYLDGVDALTFTPRPLPPSLERAARGASG